MCTMRGMCNMSTVCNMSIVSRLCGMGVMNIVCGVCVVCVVRGVRVVRGVCVVCEVRIVCGVSGMCGFRVAVAASTVGIGVAIVAVFARVVGSVSGVPVTDNYRIITKNINIFVYHVLTLNTLIHMNLCGIVI